MVFVGAQNKAVPAPSPRRIHPTYDGGNRVRLVVYDKPEHTGVPDAQNAVHARAQRGDVAKAHREVGPGASHECGGQGNSNVKELLRTRNPQGSG